MNTTTSPTAPLRIVYMGTPEFAVPPLQALIDSHHEIVGVFTNPDRPSGRGKKLTPSPVKALAVAHDIPVYQPQRVRKNTEALDTLRAFAPDLVVVAAYGQILPQEILDVPPMGRLNVHASLLPTYRGAAPINWCIVRGEQEAGITIMQMELGLDTGPMYLKDKVEITELMTAQELHDALSELGAPLLLETIEKMQLGTISPEPQDDTLASWAPMIKKSDGLVDWSASARQIADLIRGFNPWPGAYTFLHAHDADPSQQGARFKLQLARALPLGEARAILDAFAVEHQDAALPGQIVSTEHGRILVASGERGVVELLTLQAPGKRAMSAHDILNGYHIEPKSLFTQAEER